jgi:hypothetical protein
VFMNAAIKYVSTIRGTRDIFGTKNGRRHPFVSIIVVGSLSGIFSPDRDDF